MDIAKVLEETEKFEIDWNGETVTFTAKKSSCTPQFLNDIGSARNYPKAICKTLKSWDVTNGETPWLLTETEVAKLPVDFLDAILARITQSWTGDAKKPANLPNGSAVAAS